MKCELTQDFGLNANSYYKSTGLLGHPGKDVKCGWKSPVKALWKKEYVYKIFSPEKPASNGYTGIFTIVEQDGEVFEFVYGHVGDISVQEGQTIYRGQVIATEGANGMVYQGGRLCTDAESDSWGCGTHRHYQKRPIILTKSTSYERYLWQRASGLAQYKGLFCAFKEPYNGFAGCVDFKLPEDNETEFTEITDSIAILTSEQAKQKDEAIKRSFGDVIAMWIKKLADLANKV